MVKKVELIPASFWTCPECGSGQFVRNIAVEASPEEIADLRDQLGVQPWQEGVLLADPKSVTCSECNATFEAVGYMEDADTEN
ncbi:MAG: hypothetical protein AAGA03_14620 [Planctomycetota bacterium]